MMENLVVLTICGVGGLVYLLTSQRKAVHVLANLKEVEAPETPMQKVARTKGSKLQFEKAGIYDRRAQASIQRKITLYPFVTPVVLLLLRGLFGFTSLEGAFMTAMFGFAVGVFMSKRLLVNEEKRFKDRIEFFLPLAMERVVMAVEAGLDLVPALQSLTVLEEQVGDKNDPTTALFKRVIDLTDGGVRFDRSLEEVSKQIEGTSLRHAFVHLGLAYRDGGELIAPLRELSDATQLQFQEHLEDKIAKLPVKATLPLLVMFLGLMLCFLTPPALQVMSVASEMGGGIKPAQVLGSKP